MELLWPIGMIIYFAETHFNGFFVVYRPVFMYKRKLIRKNVWIVFVSLFCLTSRHKLNSAFKF